MITQQTAMDIALDKAAEAIDCAMAMFEWRAKNRPDDSGPKQTGGKE